MLLCLQGSPLLHGLCPRTWHVAHCGLHGMQRPLAAFLLQARKQALGRAWRAPLPDLSTIWGNTGRMVAAMEDDEFEPEHHISADARGVHDVLLADAVAFEDIRRNLVDAYPGWLLRLAGFLTGRPTTILEALRRVHRTERGGTAVGCVSRSWRAAEDAVPMEDYDPGLAWGPGPWPLRPTLFLAPDGRPGFSATSAEGASAWDWLEAMTWHYFVGTPLICPMVASDDGRPPHFRGRPLYGRTVSEDEFPVYSRRRARIQADEADRTVRQIRCLREDAPWGLEVGTAEQIAKWLDGGLQVTVWWGGEIFRVSQKESPIELMYDMMRYRWLVVRGGHLWKALAPSHWRSAWGR